MDAPTANTNTLGRYDLDRLEGLGVLAGGLAHNFNNLLTAILGYTSLACDMLPPGSPAREMLAEVERAANRAAGLTRQMLACSGRGHFTPEPVDLERFVQDLVPFLRSSCSSPVRLRCDLASGLSVRADASQLRQIVQELVNNAGDALVGKPEGSIVLRTKGTSLTAAELATALAAPDAQPGCYALLEVSDNGCGMTAEVLPRIFDPFFTTKFLGRGLGLAAALGIVRAHGGGVAVSSEPGQGSTFRIFLPAFGEPAPQTTSGEDSVR